MGQAWAATNQGSADACPAHKLCAVARTLLIFLEQLIKFNYDGRTPIENEL